MISFFPQIYSFISNSFQNPKPTPNTKPRNSPSPDRKEPPRFFQARGGMMAGTWKPKKPKRFAPNPPPTPPKEGSLE